MTDWPSHPEPQRRPLPRQSGVAVSVVVPAYNAAATLPACLLALRNQMLPPGEIIVVDDGSTDDTPAIARDYGVRVLATRRRSGPAVARNLGARAACYDIVAFTDADCEPAVDWLEQLVAPFDAAQGVPSGPAQDRPSGEVMTAEPVVGVRGAYRTRQRSLVARFVQQEYEHKYTRTARLARIDFIDTYSAAYRRDVFLDNGGFEVAFDRPSVEDQELSFRLARKGYKMVFAPAAIVYHHHDENAGEYWSRKIGIGYWKAFMLRWLPEKTLSDTHTPPSQRWQLALLALAGCATLAALVWPPLLLFALACLALFFATSAAFLLQIRRRDPAVLPIAPFMLLCRAAALGAGLVAGVVSPPRRLRSSCRGVSPPERGLNANDRRRWRTARPGTAGTADRAGRDRHQA
jgi:glycosyltransferase involved in cell wall biosynthesis